MIQLRRKMTFFGNKSSLTPRTLLRDGQNIRGLNCVAARYVCLLLCFFGSTTVYSGDWPYVRVSCDQRSTQLTIEELSAESQQLIPHEKGVQSLIALTEIKTINGPTGVQDYRVRKSNLWS